MRRAGRMLGCVALLALVGVAGCKRQPPDNSTSLGPVHVDTANTTPLDGMSDEQLKNQAQALTPEQAAARGMVDTTTHIEDLGDDSAAPAAPAARRDSAATQAPAAAH